MERWQQTLFACLTALILALVAFSFGFWTGSRGDDISSFSPQSGGLGGRGSELIDEAFDRIKSSSVKPPSDQELARGAIRGMVKALRSSGDPYALFYTRTAFEDFSELTTGRFSGIGVWLDTNRNRLEVLSVLPNSPALRAGLKPGDIIAAIDGTRAEGLTSEEAVAMIKGPEGSDVTVTVLRGKRELEFTMTRRSIEFPNLRSSLTEDNLGYVRLVGFAKGAGGQLRDEVKDLRERGAEGIILDMRDNGGGLFSEAIDVASVFIEDGVITTYQEPSSRGVDYEAEGDAIEDIPVVVLVNERTASASEIVAGALRDSGRAILVGSTTFGKGSVQEVIPLPGAFALKLTTASYLTPNGDNINGRGIEPDVEVPGARPLAQRTRAVEILKGIVLSKSGAQG
ncbi:MAG: S41 family peptidase [Actinomycetota bacterium]